MFSDLFDRNLIFISGKGGVGKTTVSKAIARSLARQGKRTLWCTFEDPTSLAGEQAGEKIPVAPDLWHLNCEGSKAFEEYAGMKIGIPSLTRIFLQNKLMRYLFQAAPGIHELVLLGKVWHESKTFDRVVVDMPSTGHGLAMFQSTENFIRLFKGGGPLNRDAEEMKKTFQDPARTGHLIVALPEEMPLRESLELNEFLLKLFPANPARFLLNRRFPAPPGALEPSPSESPDGWPSPFASSMEDYCRKRAILERFNLRLWDRAGITYAELGFIVPAPELSPEQLVLRISDELEKRNLLR